MAGSHDLQSDAWDWLPNGNYAWNAQSGAYSVSLSYHGRRPIYAAWARETVRSGGLVFSWRDLGCFRGRGALDAAKVACVAYHQGKAA